MFKFEVGKPYNAKVRSWPETPQYNYRGGQHELVLFYSAPTGREVRAVRKGLAQFALYARDGIIVLIYRFGDQPWSDAPFNWHLVPEGERTLPPELEPGESPLLTVMLVDADTGIVKAMRALSLGHDFGQALHAAIREQALAEFNQAAYDRKLGAVFAKYSTVELEKQASARYRSDPVRMGGRPPIHGETMTRYSAYLRQDQIDWLNQNGGSERLREIIDQAMADE